MQVGTNETRVESVWISGTKRLKLNYDNPLSGFGCNFNLLRYIQERIEAFLRGTAGADVLRGVSLAPRCTLTGINSFAGGAVLEVRRRSLNPCNPT